MSDFFPQGGLSQAYTALTRFAGIERNNNRGSTNGSGQSFAAEVDKSETQAFGDDALAASPRLSAKEEGFKEYFVASTTSYDPNAPRGSYVNIVV